MKAAIIQSNYFPWKGYFDIINDVDVFVFLEDVQYTRKDWRNRNLIKTPGGTKWITVPIIGGINQTIHEAKIDYSQDWRKKHMAAIHHSYSRAPYYDTYKDHIFEIFTHNFQTISDLNIYAIEKLSLILGIETEFINSIHLTTTGRKEDKLIEICLKLGVDEYLSGPAGANYIDEKKFLASGINLMYKDYSGYPEYQQLWGDFEHAVSIIDVIFNCGEKASQYIWGWRNATK